MSEKRKNSLRLFFHNLKWMTRVDLKKINNFVNIIDNEIDQRLKNVRSDCSLMVDNLRYELPDNLFHIQKPEIYDFEKSLDILCNSTKSLIRFGDGEILIMKGRGIQFQKPDPALTERLKSIIRSNDPDILTGINYHYWYADLSVFHDYVKFVYRTFISDICSYWESLLVPDKQYCAAGISSAYTTFKSWPFDRWYAKWRSIWDGKDITCICGEGVFKEIEHNIFDNAKSVDYLYIPSKNAFDGYDDILKQAGRTDKNRLVVLIAGPTAKPLAYDLCQDGYRCLDVGHLAKDYNAWKTEMPTDQKAIGKFFES